MAMNIKMFAIEYEIEWATPRISFGNSSAVLRIYYDEIE